MAEIVVFLHQYDHFITPRVFRGPTSPYMLFYVLEEMQRRGHKVTIWNRPNERIDGDLSILHCDCTVVPPEYLAAAQRFRVSVNGRVTDISKSKISGAVLEKSDVWTGPVIVKSNLNCTGAPEMFHNSRARARRHELPHPCAKQFPDYQLYDRRDLVPEVVWSDQDMVVEKFLPERVEGGYAMRVWRFLGNQETCNRIHADVSIIKGAGATLIEPVTVPEELRERRAELGFDFGKFDFVMHEGKPVLIDANKTPSSAAKLIKVIRSGAPKLADGLEGMLR